ncbi:MAG: hypothetical protein GXP30_04205 [Verrucomicrobia bacterium]|nr:hypothetical protein [Verrucomicrobiota bacterium]
MTAVAICISTTSCSQYAPNTKSGAVVGGLLGAGVGAIIGHQTGRGLEGAAIGGAAGAAGGALIGSARDDRERQYYNNQRYNNGHGNNNQPHYDQRGNGGHAEPRNSGEYYQHPRRQPRYYY